jgi:uncharacterized repeat protein (TIGR03837 family)
VIDNFGDIGVCWRLSTDLASRGHRVRLWVDDASALAWMAPHGATGVTVHPWPDNTSMFEPGDVVIEGFGCTLPSHVVRAMKNQAIAPRWINLEYLSAEDYVERCHGLPSPQLAGPGLGLLKTFFYPGFTSKTGGLLREPGLLQRQQRFDVQAWRNTHGTPNHPGERWVSLFAYDNAGLEKLLQSLATQPTRLLLAPGPLVPQAQQLLQDTTRHPKLRLQTLGFVDQSEYDHLLWACDINFVRGEDSFVRAQWAGRPFVWQIYPQSDGAHGAKLDAFLKLFLMGANDVFSEKVRSLHRAWNGLRPTPHADVWELPSFDAWQPHCRQWRDRQMDGEDLCTRMQWVVSRLGI